MNPEIRPRLLILLIATISLVALNQRLLAGKTTPINNESLPGNVSSGYAEAKDPAELPQALVLNEKLNAVAAEVVDLQTKKNILNYNGGQNWPAASLTKLMSAVIVDESFDPAEEIRIPESGPTDDVILPKEVYTAGDLLNIMMKASSNKAAYTFASHLPENQFVDKMNRKAAELGMADTHFADSSGLSESSRTSGDDLVKLVQYIWENHRRALSINKNPKGTITEIKSGKTKEFSSTHQFAGRSDFLGGKTGFTTSAQGNLVSVFSVQNHPVMILVLGTESRFEESEKILNFITDASRSD
ncbi:MAG: serine hydrolase [Patescibacteria group bacterium]|nr:serine hydrolase [Patescibacteria group bacterium]MCL5261775.1 serine hydrolase [Patescibacteria group bacterium]